MTQNSSDNRASQKLKVSLLQKSCLSVSCVVGKDVNKSLVDTGSQACLIDKDVFMTFENRPPLKPCVLSLTTADGSDMKVLGKVDLEFRIGDNLFCHEFHVTGLGDLCGILGMNFLENNDVTIQVSRCLMLIGGQHIQLERETTPICARVKVAKSIVIPPDCEVFVPGYAVGDLDASVNNLFEPFKFLNQRVY